MSPKARKIIKPYPTWGLHGGTVSGIFLVQKSSSAYPEEPKPLMQTPCQKLTSEIA